MEKKVQKVKRMGIQVYGKEYWDNEMVLFHLGEKVNVEIDESIIRVSTLTGTSIATFKR